MKSFPVFALTVLLIVLQVQSGTYIRYNQAGYTPDRPKSLILMSSEDLNGKSWSITKNGTTILNGAVGPTITGIGDHTSHPFNHVVDFSSISDSGQCTFTLDSASATLRISDHPYAVFITDALRHLRTARSGSSDAYNHALSHAGDSVAVVYAPDGNPTLGRWKQAEPRSTVNMTGGWYDAGDYIKFTLTIATTVYYLLEAYESNPLTFTKVITTSNLPDVLDEARFGLDYLLKTFPDSNTFVIQVGNGLDHNQGSRLPEHDALDGKRPALCAISPAHMGLSAAALAKGARVLKNAGEDQIAETYLQKAQQMFQRALKPDALNEAVFEKDATNDFYRDNTLEDNMALGALELYRATGHADYLAKAKELVPPQGNWISWGTYNFSVNCGLQSVHTASKVAAQAEIDFFTSNMDPVWGIPLEYTWGSLLCWNGAGAAAGSWNRIVPDEKALKLHLLMVDYLFGRNNWGVCFLANTRVPNSVQNIYSQIYSLSGAFPYGAVALGPGDKDSHDEMLQYFGTPPANVFDAFQTEKAVFYDWKKDFMTSETVTMSQAYAIWLLSLAGSFSSQAPADSSLPLKTSPEDVFDSSWTLSLSTVSWYLYADDEEGGNSKASWKDVSTTTALLEPEEGYEYPYAGFGFMMPSQNRNLTSFDGMILHGQFEQGMAFRVDLCMNDIADYDYHGKNIIGKPENTYSILFSEMSQQGFGAHFDFDASSISKVNINYYNTLKSASARIDSITFFSLEKSSINFKIKRTIIRKNWKWNGRNLLWNGPGVANLRLVNALGRTVWQGRLMPGEGATVPAIKGFQFLVNSKGELLERRSGL